MKQNQLSVASDSIVAVQWSAHSHQLKPSYGFVQIQQLILHRVFQKLCAKIKGFMENIGSRAVLVPEPFFLKKLSFPP